MISKEKWDEQMKWMNRTGTEKSFFPSQRRIGDSDFCIFALLSGDNISKENDPRKIVFEMESFVPPTKELNIQWNMKNYSFSNGIFASLPSSCLSVVFRKTISSKNEKNRPIFIYGMMNLCFLEKSLPLFLRSRLFYLLNHEQRKKYLRIWKNQRFQDETLSKEDLLELFETLHLQFFHVMDLSFDSFVRNDTLKEDTIDDVCTESGIFFGRPVGKENKEISNFLFDSFQRKFGDQIKVERLYAPSSFIQCYLNEDEWIFGPQNKEKEEENKRFFFEKLQLFKKEEGETLEDYENKIDEKMSHTQKKLRSCVSLMRTTMDKRTKIYNEFMGEMKEKTTQKLDRIEKKELNIQKAIKYLNGKIQSKRKDLRKKRKRLTTEGILFFFVLILGIIYGTWYFL